MRRLAISTLLAVFSVLALPNAARAADPPFALHTLDDRPWALSSQQGKVVVLDFWASWCLPCRKSFPFLDALQLKYADRGLAVAGLTLEQKVEPILAFVDAIPVRFPILRDPSGASGEAFHVTAMPTTILLDRDGRYAARFEGGDPKTHEKLEQAVVKLLAGEHLPYDASVRIAEAAQATGSVKAWERGYLADPIMSLDGDALTRLVSEHVHASKEGAAGNGGSTGGGCGCN
jgi:thiol-disulfide isomerase/thioredoxin